MSIQIGITDDLDTCFDLRRIVFIDEQNVPVEDEIDENDDTAIHLLAQDENRPLGTARIVIDGEIAKIGRVCVLQIARGQGLGISLIGKALEIAADLDGITQAKLSAQVHAIGFYEALGFTVFGPVYLDAGIKHRDMVQSLP
ncbi:MAG: putative GNAT family N-acyltransferase [Paracoccaceae bacterium]|jgi:predicted GNAT family N-acyltransferase